MSRTRVAQILDLPPPGPNDQDWEFTVPDALRTPDLVAHAFAAYESPEADDSDRDVLFDILVDVVNEQLTAELSGAEMAWDRVAALVRARPGERRARIVYWSCPGLELDLTWAIAPRARALHREVYGEDAVDRDGD
jgi:hypothetical protein